MTAEPTTPRGNGNSNGSWTSLKAWSQAIGIIGIPGAIAIFLVYVGATEIPKIARQQEQLHTAVQDNRARLAELAAIADDLTRHMQRICSNTAKDDDARQRCFDK